MNAYIRTKWALTENTPLIKAYDQKGWAETPDTKMPVTASITLLRSLHKKWTEILKQLSSQELSKAYIHPETNKHIPLSQMIANYAWHGDHHLAHINSLKRRMEW
jgi:hypothetical protein